MKRSLIFFLLILVAALVFHSCKKNEDMADAGDDRILVGISKLLSHEALDAIEKGILDYIEGTDLKVEFLLQNANGEISAASQIAKLFKEMGTDYNIAIATPTAQALAASDQKVPLIFSSVTDPESAGLTGEGMEKVCGVSDMVPVGSHLELLLEIVPEAKSIGMVYTTGEANGVALKKKAEEECKRLGLELVTAGISNSAEVMTAAESIADRVDAMYVATDNTVISAISSLSEVCRKHSLPLFSADTTSSYDTFVLLAGGFDYYESGRQTGAMLEKVIKGERPEDIGIEYLSSDALEIYVNTEVAALLGLDVSSLLEKASVIV